MKSHRVAFVLATGCMLAGLSAMATIPHGVASAAAPVASASASALSRKKRPAPPEPLESQTIPKEPSSRPTLEEWQNTTPIAVTRHSPNASACHTFRVREWLKIKCDQKIAYIRQHGGNSKEVFTWIGPDSYQWGTINGGEVMFPLRPGDQRVLEFYETIPEMCSGRQALPWLIVDEIWVEGDASPTVVIR